MYLIVLQTSWHPYYTHNIYITSQQLGSEVYRKARQGKQVRTASQLHPGQLFLYAHLNQLNPTIILILCFLTVPNGCINFFVYILVGGQKSQNLVLLKLWNNYGEWISGWYENIKDRGTSYRESWLPCVHVENDLLKRGLFFLK